MKDRPNVLVILTDQQNAAMMSGAGNDYLRTPAMDSLAAGGVRFERAYCTNPLCVPSRFSLMTGRMPSEIGLRNNDDRTISSVPDGIKELGAGWLLREAGYDPVYGGKVHLPRLSANDLGFDVVETDQRNGLADTCAQWIRGPHQRPFFMVASFVNPHDICFMAIRDSQANERERRAIERRVTECQCLDLALERPPGVGEEAFYSKHCPPLPGNFEPQVDEPEAIHHILEQHPFRARARREWGERRWREHRWAYARLTEMVDANVKRVLDSLSSSGLEDSTVVIFTSDHGDMDGAHRMEHKVVLYEEACRVPLIIRQPGTASAGAVCTTEPVSNGLDLLPTLCDYAGVEAPSGILGRSLRPLVEDPIGARGHRCVPIEHECGSAVVSERFKYVLYDRGAHREQLYDLQADPGETRNAAGDPDNASVLVEMRELFEHRFCDERSVEEHA